MHASDLTGPLSRASCLACTPATLGHKHTPSSRAWPTLCAPRSSPLRLLPHPPGAYMLAGRWSTIPSRRCGGCSITGRCCRSTWWTSSTCQTQRRLQETSSAQKIAPGGPHTPHTMMQWERHLQQRQRQQLPRGVRRTHACMHAAHHAALRPVTVHQHATCSLATENTPRVQPALGWAGIHPAAPASVVVVPTDDANTHNATRHVTVTT